MKKQTNLFYDKGNTASRVPPQHRYGLTIVFLVLPGLMFVTCGKTPQEPPGYSSFSSLPLGQQAKDFESFPISKQIDYFTYEFKHTHPFSNGFARTIAAQGDEAVPYLLTRIRSEDDDQDKLAILYIFKILFEHGPPSNPQETISSLRAVVSELKTAAAKESAEGMLNIIESRSDASRPGGTTRPSRNVLP